jgi:hypothetical protein
MSTSPQGFSVPSNSGRITTEVELAGGDDSTRILRITMRSEFWDRSSGDLRELQPQYDVTLHQIISDLTRLRDLRDYANAWLKDQASFVIDLAVVRDQSLRLSVGPSKALISSRDKPVFRLTFRSGPAFKTEWSYVVDQTCIRLLRDELEGALQRDRRTLQ